jgi:cysteine-rich repeat protein
MRFRTCVGLSVVSVAFWLGCGLSLDGVAVDLDAAAEKPDVVIVVGSDATPTGDCDPGKTEACYAGPTGTAGKGICLSGMRTCTAAKVWGPCIGEVLPKASEDCATATDDNCNGTTNEGCTKACGDGRTDSPELCDDGNMVNGDGCDSNCKPSVCGNNLVGEPGTTMPEECDDGNTTDNDGTCPSGPNMGQSCGTAKTCANEIDAIEVIPKGLFTNTTGNLSQAVTLTGTSANRMLLVAIAAEGSSGTLPTVTFGTASMLQVAFAGVAVGGVTGLGAAIWYLPQSSLPASGVSTTLSVNGAGAVVAGGATYHVFELGNVKGAPLVAQSQVINDSTVSTSISPISDKALVFDFVAGSEVTTFTPNSGQTVRYKLDGASSASVSATYLQPTQGLQNYQWTLGKKSAGILQLLAAIAATTKPVVCNGCDPLCKRYK